MWNDIYDRIQSLVALATTEKADDSTQLQTVKIKADEDELAEGVVRLQNWGLSSVPPTGSEAVVLYEGGRRDSPVVVAVDNATNRKKDLAEGDVTVYDDKDNFILLENGKITVNANGDVEIAADSIRLGGTGAKKLVVEDVLATLAAHTHPVTVGVLSGTAAASTDPAMAILDSPINKTSITEAE